MILRHAGGYGHARLNAAEEGRCVDDDLMFSAFPFLATITILASVMRVVE